MTRACHGPVRAAVGDAFTDEQISDVVERLAARYRAKTKEAPTLDRRAAMKAAAADMTPSEVKEALVQKRLRIFAERAKVRRGEAMDGMGGDPARRLLAFMEGDERQGLGRSYSVDAMGRAMETELLAEVERGLRQADLWDRITAWHGGTDAAFEENVAVEMARRNGGRETPTGDADAVKVAEVLGGAIERGRQLQNAEGAWIAKLDGYVVRQQHDALKVAGGFWAGRPTLKGLKSGDMDAVKDAAFAKAFGQWRDAISPLLAERTFAEVSDREAFLQAVWWDIVTGRHNVMKGMNDLGDYTPPASKARSVSESRVLHFTDAKAWLSYHRQYGRGSLFAAVVGDLRRSGRNAALMRAFGPAPEAAFSAEVERGLAGARAAGDAAQGKMFAGRTLQAAFEQLNGTADAPESLRMSMVGRLIRGHESISKLGGMVLSAFADLPVSVQTLARAGVPWLDAYAGAIQGITRMGGAEAREIADLLDVGARTASARLSTRFAAQDGPLGWISFGQRLNMKISGFDWWNDGLRAGVAVMLSKELGRQSDLAYGALRTGTRETLERFGIDAAAWDKLRAGARDFEGGRYVTLDAAHGDADLSLRYGALIHETLDTATSEARARERRQVTSGTRPGTIAGEAIRLYTQFWSFPQTFIGRSLAPALKGYAGQNAAALTAHLVLSTTLFGYLGMQAKQIAKGREPRPMSPDAFLASMLQGGGLGIYGDFLFGDYNRFGGSPISTLGGPAIGDFEQGMKLWGKIRSGDDPAASAFQFAKGNTPFVNTWYTRAALDYLLFWRVQEALNPGWAGRYEQTTQKQTGSDFWLKPTDATR